MVPGAAAAAGAARTPPPLLARLCAPWSASPASQLCFACPLPAQVYTLGASVTRGLGATRPEHNYANRFFSLINATFPHRWASRPAFA